jgi:hypothetical protein
VTEAAQGTRRTGDPHDPKLLDKDACRFHRQDDDTYCSRPAEYKLIWFFFREGDDPSKRHRSWRCSRHAGRTVEYLITKRHPDKIIIYPIDAPEE